MKKNKGANINHKIDFVILWVDGNDQKWKSKKKHFQSLELNGHTDTRDARFRDWGLLKYWFRGVEQFSPWVNKIYFVVDHQIPSWLNTTHPKLVVINHDDFIDKKFLPTFNANSIENNLHRIPGLSEHFVYFNDDMFIIRKTSPKDFFRNGLPCDMGIMSPVQQPKSFHVGGLALNNLGIINDNFDKNTQVRQKPSNWFNPKYGALNIRTLLVFPWKKFVGFYEPHIATSFLKSTFTTIWHSYDKKLTETTSHRFRNNYLDVNQWLFRDWQIASNCFVPRSVKFGKYFDLSKDFQKGRLAISKQKYKTICINDTEDVQNFEETRQQIINAFVKILPNKSRFEK